MLKNPGVDANASNLQFYSPIRKKIRPHLTSPSPSVIDPETLRLAPNPNPPTTNGILNFLEVPRTNGNERATPGYNAHNAKSN